MKLNTACMKKSVFFRRLMQENHRDGYGVRSTTYVGNVWEGSRQGMMMKVQFMIHCRIPISSTLRFALRLSLDYQG